MKHFEITEWCDFVRETAEPMHQAEMKGHLAEGCSKCQRTADMMNALEATARAEARHPAPQQAVYYARSIFALQMPERVNLLPRLTAHLLYDSFRDPLPAGVRSQHHISRQTLYEAGPICMDLRLDHERGKPEVSLVGQISDKRNVNRTCSGIPVYLVAGKTDVVAKSISNELGEFRMEYAPRRNLRLVVEVGEDRVIDPQADSLEQRDMEPGQASKRRQ